MEEAGRFESETLKKTIDQSMAPGQRGCDKQTNKQKGRQFHLIENKQRYTQLSQIINAHPGRVEKTIKDPCSRFVTDSISWESFHKQIIIYRYTVPSYTICTTPISTCTYPCSHSICSQQENPKKECALVSTRPFFPTSGPGGCRTGRFGPAPLAGVALRKRSRRCSLAAARSYRSSGPSPGTTHPTATSRPKILLAAAASRSTDH